MIKKCFLIVFLFLGIINSLNASVLSPFNSIEFISKKDSLKTDNSTIKPRTFENLKDKYSSEDFVYERSVDKTGWWYRFKTWFFNWLMDLLNLQSRGQASKATDLAIKVCGLIIFILVIYFIFKAYINKEGSWVFGKYSDKSIIPISDIENNIHNTDFKSLIVSAESKTNYRLAIRYYYLWLLKNLSEVELIQYDVEKTNSDYQNEIKSTELRKEFAYTSYLYNYIWYGEFNVNETQFNKAKQAFNKIIEQYKND